jgi:hypothetical protein
LGSCGSGFWASNGGRSSWQWAVKVISQGCIYCGQQGIPYIIIDTCQHDVGQCNREG